jgi:hypothetical protein
VTTAAPTTAAPYTTTAAPYSSQPAEVTTQAPAASGSGECQFVYVDAQFVLSGAGWNMVQANANAWAGLNGAVTADLASLLGRAQADVSIKSITAASNALTVVFTVRSDALAEAARIAALIRDDVPATAPLSATVGVYGSAGQSSQDVSVASHTAQSRDAYDCTGTAASSDANEITTQAPAGAPSGAPSASTPASYSPSSTPGSYSPSKAPSSGYPAAPSSYFPVYASLLVSGNGWQQIAASAWAALKAAVAGDVASALHVDAGSITINIMQATATGLRLNYTVMTSSTQEAGEVSVQASHLSSSLQLPATSVLYQQANPSTRNNVTASYSASSFHYTDSPAGAQASWMPWLGSAAVVVAVAAMMH